MTNRKTQRSEKFVRHAMAAHGNSVYLVALAELRTDPVWQTLRALPEKLRVVALLHYVEEYTCDQIAHIVGCAPTTVRTRLHRARRERRGVTRRTIVRAGAVAAGAAAAFLGANALMNHLTGKQGNWFALTAYAEGTEGGDGSRLALGETFGGHISWGGDVDPEGAGDDLLMIFTELNLTCTGDNVDTLTYRLEGDNVLTARDSVSEDNALTQPGIWIQWATTYRPGEQSSGPVESFTVDYENQHPNGLLDFLAGTNASYSVYANVTVPDDLVPVFLEIQAINETQTERSKDNVNPDGSITTVETEEEIHRQMELDHQVSMRAAELFAEELAKAALVMTATFNDGTRQTKRYSFSPCEDFAQVYDDYLTEDDEAYLAGDNSRRQELTQNPPSLYLITETDA